MKTVNKRYKQKFGAEVVNPSFELKLFNKSCDPR